MEDIKDELLQLRISGREKDVIKQKAYILNISVAEYVREVSVYSNVSYEFMKRLHGVSGRKDLDVWNLK